MMNNDAMGCWTMEGIERVCYKLEKVSVAGGYCNSSMAAASVSMAMKILFSDHPSMMEL